MKGALEEAVKEIIKDEQFDRNELFRVFCNAIGRKCNTWEKVSNNDIELD